MPVFVTVIPALAAAPSSELALAACASWDAAGTIRSKGLVNNREHLESLLEADLLGVGTLQELFAREERVAGGTQR